MATIGYSIVGVISIIFIWIVIMHLHAQHLIKKDYIFVNQKIKTDCKICFISDFHYKHFLSKKYYEKMVHQINMYQPDIVIFGGDYLHRHVDLDVKEAETFIQLLSRIKAPKRIAVLGNHDKENFDDDFWIELFSKYNIQLLLNERVNFQEFGINAVGVDDFKEGKSKIKPAYINDDFQLLITHNPDFIEQINAKQFDLVVSGHLHGGQGTIGFNLYPALRVFKLSAYGTKYRHGNVGSGENHHISTSGVGAHFGLRFFVYPEVVYIHMKKENLVLV